MPAKKGSRAWRKAARKKAEVAEKYALGKQRGERITFGPAGGHLVALEMESAIASIREGLKEEIFVSPLPFRRGPGSSARPAAPPSDPKPKK